jgi:chemotaxis methyl-accepting protein methylase
MFRERHSLRVFENRVLRRICGSRRKVIIGVWSFIMCDKGG